MIKEFIEEINELTRLKWEWENIYKADMEMQRETINNLRREIAILREKAGEKLVEEK